MTKVNYTDHPFSPNDKLKSTQNFNPKEDVKVIDGVHYFPTDLLTDEQHQVNKLPNEVWGDYTESIEGLIARAERMYERVLASLNRSEVPLGLKEMAIECAGGFLAAALPYVVVNQVFHGNPALRDYAEVATHIAAGTSFVGGLHLTSQFLHGAHGIEESSEAEEMLKQARNQAKKTGAEVIKWAEHNPHHEIAELQDKFDTMVRSYEEAIQTTKQSMEHVPFWKVAGTEMLAGLAGAGLGAATYIIGKTMLNGQDHGGLLQMSTFLTTAGMIAATHATAEIMRPQHVNTTSQNTADKTFEARDLGREIYADAFGLRHDPTITQDDHKIAPAPEQMINAPMPDFVVESSASQLHGVVAPQSAVAVARS